MKVYIAGKVSGLTPEQFHSKFEDFKERVEYFFHYKLGFIEVEAVIPCDLCQDDWDWFKCMKVCVNELMTCDTVVMMDDWTESKGATCEYYISFYNNKPIYYQKEIDEFYAQKEEGRG